MPSFDLPSLFFSPPKTSTKKPTSKKKSSQADAFSLPDDENENEGENDDSEFVYEKITLLTADGVVVLPGRKLRRSSLGDGGGSLRARWRREAEERQRREQREARRRGRPFPAAVPPPIISSSAERSAAVRALEATLPGTWARGSSVSATAAAAAAANSNDDDNGGASPNSSGLLVFASPFAVSASNGVDRGRVVRLDGYTRCPEALGAAVESAARSLRGGVVGAARRPPPPGSHLSTGLLELEVALPALHGVPPALDAFVAAISDSGRGLFGAEGSGDGGDGMFWGSAHVVERISKSWFLGGRD